MDSGDAAAPAAHAPPLARGDAPALKKAWHRLAARLHPDKVANLPVGAQVLAEEVFKQLSIAVQKETERLASRGGGGVRA